MKKRLALMIAIIISTMMLASTVIADDLSDDFIIQENVSLETETVEQEEESIQADEAEELFIAGIEEISDIEAVTAEELPETVEEILEGALDEPSTIATSSFSSASNITLGSSYDDAITSSSKSSYYKFTLSASGTVTLTSTAYMKYISYLMYDQDGSQVWSYRGYWNSSTEQITVDESVCLTSGTYYLKIEQYSSYVGEYKFKVEFSSSGENFVETTGGSNNSLSTANLINLGGSYKGQIAANDAKDYYKFTLSSSGTVSLIATAYMKYVSYKLFDENGVQLWSDREYWNSSTGLSTLVTSLSLTSGSYYLEVEQYSSYTGDYTFNISFASSDENFKETNGGVNNSLASANTINLNTYYNGQIAINDSKDFYKFTLSSAMTLTLESSAGMKYLSYIVYDESGTKQWSTRGYWNSSTGKITINSSFTLSAGTYYLEIEQYSSYTGDYTFAITRSVGSCSISSLTNKDSGVKIKWSKVSSADGYYIYRKTGSGSYTKIKTIKSNSTVSYTDKKIASNNGATYTYMVVPYLGSVEGTGSVETIVRLTGTSLTSAKNSSAGKATIKWTAVSGVTGYQIQYSTSNTFSSSRKVKVSGASSVSKVLNLTKGKTYYVRIRTYKTVNGTTYYSAWSSKLKVKITK